MLRGRGVGRLEEARELTLVQGALATAAVVDVQIAAALVIRDDPEAGAVAARRSAELARRYRLDQTLAAAVALEAYVHARSERRTEMQRCIDEALAVGAGVPDIEVKTSTAAALLGLAVEDRAAARRHLRAGLRAASCGGRDHSGVPAVGLLALLRRLDGPDDEAPGIEIPEESVHFMASAFLRYADAVAAGRRGDAELAAELMAEGDRTLGAHQWFRHLGWRLVAEAAVVGGWGDPVPSLRAALDFFDRRGNDHIASACRSLLRRPEPRSRAAEVRPASPVSSGRSASPRVSWTCSGCSPRACPTRTSPAGCTCRRAPWNATWPLAVKTCTARRAQLVAYAARAIGAGAPSS
jgi:hypothetical protein